MREPDFTLREMAEHLPPKKPSTLLPLLRMLWNAVERVVLFLWNGHRTMIACIIIALLFAWLVPYNTDEFIHYHALLCHAYPMNALNTFTGACGALDLNVLNTGLVLPLRAYLYSGSFPSLYYLPLFWLWPSPVSARLLNILFLLAQSMVLARMFRLKTWHVFLGLLLFFPYSFQHIVDTGPVAFQVLVVYCCAFLFARFAQAPTLRDMLLVGLLLFLAVWTKLIFFALFPSIAILFFLAVSQLKPQGEQQVARISIAMLSGLLLFLALTAVLLLSTDPADPSSRPLLNQLFIQGKQHTFAELFAQLPTLSVTKALLNPLAATHRIYDVWPIASTGLARLYAILLYCGVPLLALRYRATRSLLLYGLFLLTFLLIARTKEAWAMHHTILAFPFLVLSILTLLTTVKAKTVRWSLGVFLALNCFWFAVFPFQAIHSSDDPSKERINALLQDEVIGKEYFYVVTDWGMYFYQGLYGPTHQGVLYVNGLVTETYAGALRKLASEHNRHLLFIVHAKAGTTDIAQLARRFGLTRCEAINEQDAWQLWYEPISPPSTLCRVPEA